MYIKTRNNRQHELKKLENNAIESLFQFFN